MRNKSSEPVPKGSHFEYFVTHVLPIVFSFCTAVDCKQLEETCKYFSYHLKQSYYAMVKEFNYRIQIDNSPDPKLSKSFLSWFDKRYTNIQRLTLRTTNINLDHISLILHSSVRKSLTYLNISPLCSIRVDYEQLTKIFEHCFENNYCPKLEEIDMIQLNGDIICSYTKLKKFYEMVQLLKSEKNIKIKRIGNTTSGDWIVYYFREEDGSGFQLGETHCYWKDGSFHYSRDNDNDGAVSAVTYFRVDDDDENDDNDDNDDDGKKVDNYDINDYDAALTEISMNHEWYDTIWYKRGNSNVFVLEKYDGKLDAETTKKIVSNEAIKNAMKKLKYFGKDGFNKKYHLEGLTVLNPNFEPKGQQATKWPKDPYKEHFQLSKWFKVVME